MTKTLTENKWFYTENGIKDASWNIVFKSEVIAPVPSYDEYKRLQEQIKEANEIIKECCKRIEFTQVCLASFPPKFKIDDCLYNELEDYFKKYDINWGVK